MDIDSIVTVTKNTDNHSTYSKSSAEVPHSTGSGIKFLIEKDAKVNEKIKKKIPFLKEFNPKFTKRENIDKKVLRKFKKYLKDYYKSKKHEFEKLENKDFWLIFLNGNLFPPMKFFQKDLNRTVEFKSFNTQYMAWIFSNKPSNQLYDLFLKEKGEELFNSIIKKFNIPNNNSRETQETLFQLRNYVFNIAEIFAFANKTNNSFHANLAPSSVSNSTWDKNTVIEESTRRENDLVENCIEMPAALPNSKGDIFDQLDLSHNDRRDFEEDQIYYNNDQNPCSEIKGEVKDDDEGIDSLNTSVSSNSSEFIHAEENILQSYE